MSNYILVKRLNYLLLLSFFISPSLYSQTLLFGDTGNGNFENGTTGWTVVNGSQANKWVVSNNATPGFSGSNCIYISSSPATPYAHTYNEGSASRTYFYRDVDVPADAKKLWLTFDYISNGETAQVPGGTLMRDILEVGVASAGTAITAGQSVQLTEYEWYYGKIAWVKKEVKYFNATAYAGTKIRVVFGWENNSAIGNQPPAALDNIEMYASCQEMWPPTLSDRSATSARIVWSSIPGATGYEVRYRKTTDPATVTTYTNPVTVSGGASAYFTSINNLTPSTSYYVEMRPTGLTCTDWTLPLTLTTLTPPANDSCSGAIMLAVEANACEGTPVSFYGATPTAGLGGSCIYDINDDVWYKFVATQTTQVIQTAPVGGYYTPLAISLFTGNCTNLQLVPTGCIPASTYSPGLMGDVNRLVATGLTVGATYYVRVNASTNNSATPFKICVYNSPPTPACPVLITPSSNLASVNYGVSQVFKWNKTANATAYRLLIVEQSGAYAQIDTKDTFYTYRLDAGKNYTWKVVPYNIQDGSITCGSFAFSTCSSVASGVTLSSTSATKCAFDSVKISATPAGSNRQWFLNGEPISGATGDTIWAKVAGNYTVRVLNGSCYSDPSNTVIITDLATPTKQKLTVSGITTFCQGGSVNLATPFSLNNQWFNGSAAISGSIGSSYTATQAGSYYVRLTNTSSGCSSYSDTVVVTVNPTPATPVITAGGSTSLCTGESVTLSSSAAGNQWYKDGVAISGATAQQYSASQAGSYTVAVTQSGCPSAQSTAVNVTVNAAPAAPVLTSSGALTFCAGDSVRLQSSVATGNQWYKDGVALPGATGQQLWVKDAGAYSAKVTTGSCVSGASVSTTVIVNPLPAQPVITGVGGVLSTSTGYASYQWYFNGTAVAGATSSQYTTLQNGIYRVEVSGANGCKVLSTQFNQVAAAVSEIVWADYTIKLYPNPVQDLLTIKVAATTTAVRSVTADVVDVNGKLLKTTSLKAGLNSLDLRNLPQGVYSVVIKNNKGQQTIQVVKVH